MSEDQIQTHVNDEVQIQRANSIWDDEVRGEYLWTNEPPRGSVVLAFGLTGTAYQRWYSDGLWHGSNGRVSTWHELIQEAMGNILIATWVVEK